jgi:hypothetical protein
MQGQGQAYLVRQPDARVGDLDALLALGEHDLDERDLEREAEEQDAQSDEG